ncbi:hypothetical protein CHX26_11945 [Porphyrobacter sp. HT-58-2]|uniref:hypothetical protein n=1 Tax=Porphyrobacter sp. HT-58-2 TaxID=2023229 RepID=UPI000CDBB000|nr:hypothetical protein [Porphyrobacter sp. HT-58-2]AUX70104.1 hypothetical protein CHX26_11945 [Porphyrobacter sp. HT-58-2]
MMRAYWLAGAALMMASGAQAADPAQLDCMANSYTDEQTGQIDGLLPQIDMLSEAESPAMEALGMVAGTAVLTCAATHQWGEADFEPAIFFELGRLMEQAIRRHGPLSRDEVAKVDAALAKGDRSSLWTALEEQVALGVAGQTDEVSPRNAILFGAFMLELGIGTDEAKGEQVGAFLGAMAMQRSSRRAFAEQ